MEEFLTDITTLRERTRSIIDKGPISDASGVDVDRVIYTLNHALAIELVCVLRYKRHYFTAEGLHAQATAEEFRQHAVAEVDCADTIAARIHQLGGEPDFYPDILTGLSHFEDELSMELDELIREDLVAERVVITAYEEIIAWLGKGIDVKTDVRRDPRHRRRARRRHARSSRWYRVSATSAVWAGSALTLCSLGASETT